MGKRTTYSLVLIVKDEYTKANGRRSSFWKNFNRLDDLMKYLDRHTKRYLRNPWQYFGIYKNPSRTITYKPSEQLMFMRLAK